MTNPKRALLLGLATVAVAGCQTIREELPTAANPASGGSTAANVPAIPVVVVPIPVPVPTSVPAPAPTTPTSPSNPSPNATPRPPSGPVNPGNNSSTVRIGAKVYFVERNGQILPESENARECLVGDRIHFDATAKDAQNIPTTTQGHPNWSYSDMGLISVSSSGGDWTPVAIARRSGTLSVSVEADGVRSNTVTISIR